MSLLTHHYRLKNFIPKILLLSLFILNFASCALLNSVKSPTGRYRDFINSRVAIARLYDRGRDLLAVKAILADKKLYDQQEEVTPGFHFPIHPENSQAIIALDMSTWERFSPDDLKIFLDGERSTSLKELVNPMENETHYPFAHPHYRVFCVDFPASSTVVDKHTLTIQSLRGELRLQLKM